MVSLLLTFIFFNTSFLFQYISWRQHKCVSEHLRRNKYKMRAEKKTIEEKQTILFKSMQRLRKDFVLHS